MLSLDEMTNGWWFGGCFENSGSPENPQWKWYIGTFYAKIRPRMLGADKANQRYFANLQVSFCCKLFWSFFCFGCVWKLGALKYLFFLPRVIIHVQWSLLGVYNFEDILSWWHGTNQKTMLGIVLVHYLFIHGNPTQSRLQVLSQVSL